MDIIRKYFESLFLAYITTIVLGYISSSLLLHVVHFSFDVLWLILIIPSIALNLYQYFIYKNDAKNKISPKQLSRRNISVNANTINIKVVKDKDKDYLV